MTLDFNSSIMIRFLFNITLFLSIITINDSIIYESRNVSTEEFRLEAAITYAKVLPCIMSAWMMETHQDMKFEFPMDAQYHFEDLKNRTEKFRHPPIHEYANYSGPWIENIFIKEFMDRPLSYFNGFIPIYIQWIDTQILRGRHFDYIRHELFQALRPNVLYLAISQGDVGLTQIGTAHPNILVLSAGGFGHVPIPLVRGEMDFIPPPITQTYEHNISFFGTMHHSRPEILSIIRDTAKEVGLNYMQGQGL